jgi:nitrogen-specific signal transduction histidine kinase
MLQKFEEYQSLKGWIKYQRLEQMYAVRLMFVSNLPDDDPNKEELIQSSLNLVHNAHRSRMEQRELYVNSVRK